MVTLYFCAMRIPYLLQQDVFVLAARGGARLGHGLLDDVPGRGVLRHLYEKGN